MKKVGKITFRIAVVLAGIVVLAIGLFWLFDWIITEGENNWYYTEDISDYGEISHNGKNAIPQELFQTFFPETLEPYFEDIQYKYCARDWCDYCCEIYLEFKISDSQLFGDYVKAATEGISASEFVYDTSLTDYVIADDLPLHICTYTEEGNLAEDWYVEGGNMGRILVNEKEQKVIYTMVMVTSCCGENPERFYFYERFGIDPLEYAQEFSKVRYSELD